MLRYSIQAIEVIPVELRFTLHETFEDRDLEGAEEAEKVVQFLEEQTPGVYVGILANDSVTPPCSYFEGHFSCDYYDPIWKTFLVFSVVLEEYKDMVDAKELEWKHAHGHWEGETDER